MKHIKNILKSVGVAACLGVTVSSCSLDLLPLNEVVLENYWTDKNDVESVLNSCYTAMQASGWMNHALIWGEVRSDNITSGANIADDNGLRNLIKGNLKSTNSACDWTAFYTCINYCNTVIYYAPLVAERDPNFTESDLKNTLAQAKTIRALNYFYLIRTFKDVPFSFEPSIDDNQPYAKAASDHVTILDSLIADLEPVKDDVPRVYTTTTTSSDYDQNSGRITRVAIYALLADMYLWRASDYNLDVATQRYYYQKCIEMCDYVIDFKISQYDEDPDNTLKVLMDTYVYSTYGYPLLAEKTSTGGSSSAPEAYNAIFGAGNSWESLFEITYTHTIASTENKNTALGLMYGSYAYKDDAYKQYLSASTTLMESKLSNSDRTYSNNTLFPVCTDYRTLTGFRYSESGNYDILKYMVDEFFGTSSDFGTASTSSWAAGTSSQQSSSRTSINSSYENWIIYRLTDVMLMRAEAEIQIAGLLSSAAEETADTSSEDTSTVKTRAAVDGSSLSTADELYDDAFNLISAVYMRSNPNAQSNTTQYRPQRSNFSNYADFEELVENERHREFLFEGKRYYDLVRRARREGNTSHFSTAVAAKFGEASKAVLIKMAMLDFMYMPYYKTELDVNPYLSQNPAYPEDEENTKN